MPNRLESVKIVKNGEYLKGIIWHQIKSNFELHESRPKNLSSPAAE